MVFLLALAGVLAFFVAQGGLWAYLGNIAKSNGISQYLIGVALSASSLFNSFIEQFPMAEIRLWFFVL